MRKLMLRMTLLILVLLAFSVFNVSYGENVVYVQEIDMSIALPEDYLVFTRSTNDNDLAQAGLGIKAKDLIASMELYNEYLDALYPDYSNEIVLYVEESNLENINFAMDFLITNLADSIEASYDRNGLISEGYDLIDFGSCRVVKLFSCVKDNPNIHRLQYFTIQKYKDIRIVLYSYNGKISYKDELMMDRIVEKTLSLLFDKEQDNTFVTEKREIQSGSFTYIENEDGTVTITNYTGNTKELRLPSILDDRIVSGLSYNAFNSAKDLESVELSKSIEHIDGNPFSGCNNLKRIIVDPENDSFIVDDGILFTKDRKSVVSAPRGDKNKIIYSVPDGTEEIKSGAFDGFVVFDLYLPSSLRYIGESAFSNNSALRTMIIPNGVIEIGEKAFFQCYALTRCILPKSIVSINQETFYSCTALTEIDIPESVRSLGIACFRGCGLIEVELPEGLDSIPDYAFANCHQLKKIIIPGSVISISDSAFIGCSDDITLFVSDGSYALSYAKSKGLKYVVQNN